jgi:carbonic anhydrase
MDITGVNVTGGQQYSQWDGSQFSFLPSYRSAPIDTDQSGVTDFVYKIYLQDTSSQYFYAADPQTNSNNRQVLWDFDHIRFHSPAEHTFNGTQYDLEMQIFHSDNSRRSIICLSRKSATSVFFSLTSGEATNFFDFQTTNNLDLNTILDVGAALRARIYGYKGTDSMPPCTLNVCWFIYDKVFKITAEQLQFFKDAAKVDNYRKTNLADSSNYNKNYYHDGIL